MMGVGYVNVALAFVALVVSTTNLLRYFPIWKEMRTAASLLLLSFPVATWVASAYHVALWFVEQSTQYGEDIPTMVAAHALSLGVILAVCCFQLLLLLWRPSWFRRQRRSDRKL